MTTPFPATTLCAGVLVSFIILSSFDDEITTLPVKLAPSSLDYVPDSLDYSPDSDLDPNFSKGDSLNEDVIKTTETPHTHIASTSVLHPLPSLLSSSSSPPSSLLPLSSSPSSSLRSPSLLPLFSYKRPRLPSPLPLQHDVVTRGSLRISRDRITRLYLRAMYAELEVKELREFRVTDKLKILELYSRAEAEVVERRAEALQALLRAARMDARDLIESRKAERLKMDKLRSQMQDIEASFWEIERHLSP
nr:hypothetical protein [Tanacetum cinerariifolium]